jgi:hypothetical protein
MLLSFAYLGTCGSRWEMRSLADAIHQVEMLLKEMKLLRDQASIAKSLGESMEKRANWIEAGLVSVWEAVRTERGKE